MTPEALAAMVAKHRPSPNFNRCDCGAMHPCDAAVALTEAARLAEVVEGQGKRAKADDEDRREDNNKPAFMLSVALEREKVLREALESVAQSPQPNCTGEHKLPCDCVGFKARAAMAPEPEPGREGR